ncbi:Norsolorinic acid ketoreductase [Escovopsis weberi]|uniref:Norsolorinic acid ketoreductase n=1 Tax=Escovopsis weberi TaxID=150374 RepID=A0A0M9VRW0_ESCWE|nr:Norsolorinic acid ketoreductase [Escovopsis weberi]
MIAPPPTIVLITGAGRGIGKALTAGYLSLPNHTVIGTIRDSKQTAELRGLSTASNSRLLLVNIESSCPTDPQRAVKEIQAMGIHHLDIVIANSAVCPAMVPLDLADANVISSTFNINTLAPILLFQAVKPMLERSMDPKWVSVSSSAGSVAYMKANDTAFSGAYGLSKAAMNWFTVGLHSANKFLTAFVIHPGFVPSDMGIHAAKYAGVEAPPETIEDSYINTIDVSKIARATREETSGKFINVIDRTVVPW